MTFAVAIAVVDVVEEPYYILNLREIFGNMRENPDLPSEILPQGIGNLRDHFN